MSDTEEEAKASPAPARSDPPKDPTGIATTQTSLISPLQDPVAVAARAAERAALKRTAIGIAPPAMGSKQPPKLDTITGHGTAPPPGAKPPPRVETVKVETKALPKKAEPVSPPASVRPSRPPPGLPSGGSRPPPSSVSPASKPPLSTSKPSKPPIAPSRPPIAPSGPMPAAKPVPSMDDPPPPSKPLAPRRPSVPASPIADTVLAMEAPKIGGDTAKSFAHDPANAPAPPAAPVPKLGSTLIGTAPPPAPLMGPSKIVPRRRTPAKGIPAAAPIEDAVPTKEQSPRITPAAGTPPLPPDVPKPPMMTTSVVPAKPSIVPPVIRIPGAGAIQTKQDGTLICEILLRYGSVTQEKIDEALAIQEERGGQIGRILVQLGACSEEAIARALIEQLKTRKDGGFYISDISNAAREKKDVAGLKVLTRPTRTVATLLLTDLFSLLLAAMLATSVHWFRIYHEEGLDWTSWLVVGPSVVLCMLTFLGLELYSPMAKSTPDEIRDITFATSLVHLGASVLSTLGDLPIVKWGIFVRTVWWVATLFLVPVIRALVRNYFSVQPWWGIPVVVLGAAKTGRLVVRTLKAQPRSGLKPVMLLDDDKSKYGTLRASFTNEVMDVYSVNVTSAQFLTEEQRAEYSNDIFGDDYELTAPISSDHIPVAPIANTMEVSGDPARDPASVKISTKDPKSGPARPTGEFFNPESQRLSRSQITKDASQFPRGKFAEVDGVPLVGDLNLGPVLAKRLNIPYAVVAMPGLSSPDLLKIIERVGGHFTHLLIIPDLFGLASMGVPAKSLGGILGVEVRQQLLLPGPRLAKRVMDTVLTTLGGLFVAPFLLLIAALIKLDSKGPVFYSQNRLGKDGSYFKAYKFRTMHGDGEERLKAILDSDPALRAEYDIYHKLKKDPRVTRIGRFLRKFSLDEFPQLLNVIKGDMSLVGPRPYIERELTEMNGQEKIILRAPPGMTGMWQVSDRNATSFAQRCQIDVYYVRNWSPWLDIHILAKTFGVVIKGSGV
ncbi:MAG: sugar transferase [Labilithrix sp.]|nr:sugar transferase [Labilithrix sp.]MCW5812175.1 sugar transferase [Labilithrix sp.]